MKRSALMMRLLRAAAVCALVALALMVWGVIDPHPISLVIAMSVGQALGTLSFALYGVVVFADLKRSHVFPGLSSAPPSSAESDPPGRKKP